MDNPSFSSLPWIGLLAVGLLCLTATACAAATGWVHGVTQRLRIANAGRWNLLFGGICLALVIGTVFVGIFALPAAWLLLLPALIAFTRRRDAAVPAERRYLGRGGTRAIAADIRSAIRRRQAAGRSGSGGFREQLAELTGKLRSAAGKGKRRKAAAADATQVVPDRFEFLKKDGTVAISLPAEGTGREIEGVSENVCNARNVMVAAMRADATDLHFEPHEQQYFVRVRVDGVLKDLDRMDFEMGKGVISAIKVVSDMDIAERRRPQDGTFSSLFAGTKYDIRVASTPTSYGEKMVMRLLKSSGGVMASGLDGIGLRPPVLKQLREIIHKPYGMFLVAGPTGSGKTTTVYASLSEIDAHQHNITTIEDPVEYRLDNITQIAVNTKADVSFASILRSVLRQDPDVLLVGEIRDRETAEIACQAALTGHFVFSTLRKESLPLLVRARIWAWAPESLRTRAWPRLGEPLQAEAQAAGFDPERAFPRPEVPSSPTSDDPPSDDRADEIPAG